MNYLIANWRNRVAVSIITSNALLAACVTMSGAEGAGESPVVIKSVTPEDAIIVVVGTEGRRLLTRDGKTWEDQPKTGRYFQPGPPPDRFEGYSGHDNTLHAIISLHEGFMAAGNYGNVIVESDNGKEWGDLYTADKLALSRDIRFGNGITLVVGWKNDRGNALGILDAEKNWEFVELPEELSGEAPLRSLAFGEGVFVCVTDDGAIGTTRDGEEWLQLFPPIGTTEDRFRVYYGDGKFLILGHRTSLISEDGLSWEAVELPGKLPAGTVPATWTGQGFVVINYVTSEVYWSDDGIEWEGFPAVGDIPKVDSLLAAHGQLFGLDYGLRIVSSRDGVEWKTIFNGSDAADYSNQFHDLAVGAPKKERISRK